MDLELNNKILKTLSEKGLNTESFLEGLKSVKPLTYWDYIQTDALWGLKTKRHEQQDEIVLIVNHQMNAV